MSKKILIADDDPGVVALLKKMLTAENYSVITAADGLDALVLIRKEIPDLIILDVMMPEVNGYDVCFHLKFDDQYKHIPIILLTVRQQELNVEIGKKAKIEYMQKPVNSKLLIEKINDLFSTKVKDV